MKNKKYEIKYLTKEFYLHYDEANFPEILHKEDRPYFVFVIKIKNNTFAVPFRTNISHNQSYKFKNSNKATKSHTGLDFSKSVIVNEDKYIGTLTKIDSKEYVELENRVEFIIKKFTVYIKNYIKYVKANNTTMLNIKYQYSSLKYFKYELGLDEDK